MKQFSILRRLVLSVVLLVGAWGAAGAAEIQVITSGAFATALKELAPVYEKNQVIRSRFRLVRRWAEHLIRFRLAWQRVRPLMC